MLNKPVYPLIYATGTGLYTNTEGLIKPSVLKDRDWQVLTLADKGDGYFTLDRIGMKAPSAGCINAACPVHHTQQLRAVSEDTFVCIKCNPTANLTFKSSKYK